MIQIDELYYILSIIVILFSLLKYIDKKLDNKIRKYLEVISEYQKEQTKILRILLSQQHIDKKLYDEIDYELKNLEKRLSRL